MTKLVVITLMEISSFQVNNDWLYVLYANGTMARKYLKDKYAVWEKVEMPEIKNEEPLLVDKVSNAGTKNITISKRDTE